MNFYPWHENIKQRLSTQFVNHKLAHALLFDGPEKLGKFDFAYALSALFMCENALANNLETQSACGHCKSCDLLKAGSHPDLRIVQPEDSKQIKIDQIRSLISWTHQTALLNGLKIAIVNPAQQMNPQSANALLKCLEEPAADTLIFLVTPRAQSLLPTIRSRCQRYQFGIPERSESLAWLKIQSPELSEPELMLDIVGGIPKALLENLDSAFLETRQLVIQALKSILVEKGSALAAVGLFKKPNLELVLETCAALISDCIKYKATRDDSVINNKDFFDDIETIAELCSTPFLFSANERVCMDLKVLRSTANPSEALLLESLVIDLSTQQSQAIS